MALKAARITGPIWWHELSMVTAWIEALGN